MYACVCMRDGRSINQDVLFWSLLVHVPKRAARLERSNQLHYEARGEGKAAQTGYIPLAFRLERGRAVIRNIGSIDYKYNARSFYAPYKSARRRRPTPINSLQQYTFSRRPLKTPRHHD